MTLSCVYVPAPPAGRPRDRFNELTLRRAHIEAKLTSKGVRVSAPHRDAWAASMGAELDGMLCIEAANGDEDESRILNVEASKSYVLPGFRQLRLPHVSRFVSSAAFGACLDAIKDHAARSRVLQIIVEVVDCDADVRADLSAGLESRGFTLNPTPRSYSSTLRIDLERSPEQILAGVSRRCRRAIQKANGMPYSIRRIEGEEFDERIRQLCEETFARSDAQAAIVNRDWESVRHYQNLDPAASCLLGLFHDETDGPESLVSVSWGLHHGEHAVYEFGASTRDPRIEGPLGYALLWELILWAQKTEAAWFDMGGTWKDPAASVAGIEAFKRAFTKDEVRVRDEWIYDPHPSLTRIARGLRSFASVMRLRG